MVNASHTRLLQALFLGHAPPLETNDPEGGTAAGGEGGGILPRVLGVAVVLETPNRLPPGFLRVSVMR